MTLRERAQGATYFLWDDARAAQVHVRLFDPVWWREQGRLSGQAEGRGAAYFLDGLDGTPWVLRHNRRGGLLAQFNHDRYLWTGRARARALAELRLLADMRAQGLPVPAPVAARVSRNDVFYRADIIVTRVEAAQPLADRLAHAALPADVWQRLGRTLAWFHRGGIWHGDLNARNILVDDDSAFYLIDFDKAARRSPGRWRETNLARLHRSLTKFRRAQANFGFLADDWEALRVGYTGAYAGR